MSALPRAAKPKSYAHFCKDEHAAVAHSIFEDRMGDLRVHASAIGVEERPASGIRHEGIRRQHCEGSGPAESSFRLNAASTSESRNQGPEGFHQVEGTAHRPPRTKRHGMQPILGSRLASRSAATDSWVSIVYAKDRHELMGSGGGRRCRPLASNSLGDGALEHARISSAESRWRPPGLRDRVL